MPHLLIVLAFLAIYVSGCTIKHNQSNVERSSFVLSDTMLKNIKLDTASMQQLYNELKYYGKITTDANKLIEIFPVIGGNVVKVNVELGDYVKKGQLLAVIRSTEVAGFEKELMDAQNDVLVARNNLKVAQELFEGKLNTERDVVEAKSELEKAQSQLRRIEEVYRVYSLRQGSLYEVRAPISGFIVQKNINEDMQLRSDRSDNIFDIAQIEDVWAIANVNESEIGSVKLGVDAFVTTLSYGDRVFQGKVDKIYNIIDPETKAMKIRVRLNNPDYLLKPEMRAVIQLRFFEDKKMVCIPADALIFDRSKYYVMIFKDRYNIETREVQVFREVGGFAYISSGLAPAEIVISRNQLLIYDALND